MLAFRIPSDALGRMIAGHDEPRRFCHVELVFDPVHNGVASCFSAHIDEGTRWRTLAGLDDPREWACVRLPDNPQRDVKLREWCDAHAGRKYDTPGVLGFELGFVHDDPTRWFCSEAVLGALIYAGEFAFVGDRSGRVSPNLLYMMAMSKWGQP